MSFNATADISCGVASDDFSSSTYSAQDGNGFLEWKGDWLETGDDLASNSGDFRIEGGHLAIFSDCCAWDNPNDSIEREIDLSSQSNVELRVNLNHVLGLSKVKLQISNNGGGSWADLQVFTGSNGGYKSYVYDISSYASVNTRIRFLNSRGGGGLDWVGVEAVTVVSCSGTPNEGPASCSDVFAGGISVNNESGRVRILNKGQVFNIPSNKLNAPWVNHIAYTADQTIGMYSCVSENCKSTGKVAPTLNYGSFPVWSSSTHWTTGTGSDIGVNTNYYDTVKIPILNSAKVDNTNYNTFYIKRLQMGPGAKLTLASGDYYIERFTDLVGTPVINTDVHFIIPEDAKVRLFIYESDVTLYTGVKFNVLNDGTMGKPENLLMYFYTDSGNLIISSVAAISGYLYAPGFVSFAMSLVSSPSLIGALSAGDVYMGPGVKLNYNEAGLDMINFKGACISPAVDHYVISHSGSGVTCNTVPINISAHKADGSNYIAGGKTINLSTTTGHGSWVLLSGSGSLTDSVAGDGSASYTFAAGESSVQLGFKNTHAETLNINVSDGSASESASADPNLTMNSAGLVFLVDGSTGNIDTQIAGKATNIDVPQGSHARSVNLGLRVISTDPNTGACTSRVPAGNHSVQWGFECNEPATCQLASPGQVNGLSVTGNNNAVPIAYTSFSTTFDNNATTSFNLNYLDAGRVTLHAKMSVAATATEPAITLTQSTNAFVVRPFGIGFSDIQSDAGVNNKGTLPSDSSTSHDKQFATAGGTFDFSLAGYRYNPLHDAAASADRNGYPAASANVSSNTITANFTGSASVVISSALPASGSSGVLGKNDTLTLTAGGATRYENQSWSEVGTLKLSASVSDYLSTGVSVNGTSPNIGRFYPAGFVLGAARSVTPRAYMGQPFELAYQLKAVNGSGGVTANYDDALGYSTSLVKYSAENNNDGNDIVNRLSFEPGGWKAGMYGVLSAGIVISPYQSNSLVYDKPAVSSVTLQPNSKASPLENLKIGISVVGAIHGVQGVADMNATTTGDCVALSNCDVHSLGSVNLHYGRLVAIPAQGTEDASKPLEVRFEMQYWDGARFVRDRNDSTTPFYQLAGGGIYSGTPTFESYKGGLSPGEISITAPVLSRFANGITPVGDGFKFTNVPGIGNRGSVNVRFSTADIADWAEYDRDGDADTNNDGVINVLDTPNDSGDDLIVPISFAPKRGHDNIILWKENP